MEWITMNKAETSLQYLKKRNKKAAFLKLAILLIQISILCSCGGTRIAVDDADAFNRKEKKRKISLVIQTCKGFLGTPYQWGGTTRSGLDCSGLLYISYQMNGIKIPRTSNEQSMVGKKVSKKKLKEGDWVFFASGKKKNKITHVGLVTQVKNKEKIRFIHASSSLGVVENNFFAPYYEKIFVRAIRPF